MAPAQSRGAAWESVKRNFRELGLDTQSTEFTVIGVGDMSGDVFGNGMLLSRKIRLLGAFNHRHIFLCILVFWGSCTICFADRIILKEGQIITGKILTEKKTQIYIDIGITVLAVPKETILEYEYSETLTVDNADLDQNNPSDKNKSTSFISAQDDKLYKTAITITITIELLIRF